LLLIFFSTFSVISGAQSLIHGSIVDENGAPLPYISVLLLHAADSTLVKGTVSSKTGTYSFENIGVGKYKLSYSAVGMETHVTAIIEISASTVNKDIGTYKLLQAKKELGQVNIVAKKPLFEQKIDRMVINVKGSITDAGGSALDVLEKSPGVIVSKANNTISIAGKNGVNIMINGKLTYMPMDAVMQLLAGTSASNIDRIELITTPPAKYDAEGNAGYINIVLLNNTNAGLNGSYFLTAGYGKKENPSAGANFNYRNGKINVFGTYSFTRDHVIQPFDNFRQILDAGNIITTSTNSHRNAVTNVYNVRMGMDYQADSSNVIGIVIGGYDSHWSMLAHNTSIQQKNGLVDSIINTTDNEINHWQNLTTNLNFQHTFKPNEQLNIDANYIYYKDYDPNSYANSYYDGNNNFLKELDSRTGKVTPINFKVLSGDYTMPIGKKITMEAGAKLSLSQFKNDISADNLQQGVWVTNQALSADYLLKENIGAAYISFTDNVSKKVTIKAGLRYEHTSSNLGTTDTANIVDRHYGEFFPTFYISDNLDDKNNSINFSYSRRITRPTFNDLAPFTIFLDPTTFFTGNPALQPAIANSLQASFVHNDFILSLSYTHEDNTIESFQNKVDTVNNTQFISAYNFKYTQYFTLSVSVPVTVNKWWTMQNNVQGNSVQINTTSNGAPVRYQSVNFGVNSTQRFTLPNDFSIEATGYYFSAALFGSQTFNPVYQVDMGIQKKFKNKKDVLRLAANDMFNTGTQFTYVDNLPDKNTKVRGSYNFDQMVFKLTYTHSFGNTKLKGQRDRDTGAEDELKRVHN